MIPVKFQKKLNKVWKDIFRCRHCGLPDDYTPQYRPIGRTYNLGGILFAQINPGHIGCLTQVEIEKRYKREDSRQKAHRKQLSTSYLLSLQNAFIKESSIENWNQLNNAYNDAVRKVWGWPPGKYLSTIEKHGVNIEDVALINIAQCPVPNNKYTKQMLSDCWKIHTKKLIAVLKPRLVVAQGKAVFGFLKNQDLIENANLIKGNHHASRQRTEIKKQIFHEVKNFVMQSGVK